MKLETETNVCHICRNKALGLTSPDGSITQLPVGWFRIESTRLKKAHNNEQVCSLECAEVVYLEEEA